MDHYSTDFCIRESQISGQRWESVVHDPFGNLVQQSLIQKIVLFIQTLKSTRRHYLGDVILQLDFVHS